MEFFPFGKKHPHSSIIKAHYWIDLLIEIPLIIGVITTGIIMIGYGAGRAPSFHMKLTFAIIAILMNLVCIFAVIKRRRALVNNSDEKILCRWSRIVWITALIGTPAAVITVVLGFSM